MNSEKKSAGIFYVIISVTGFLFLFFYINPVLHFYNQQIAWLNGIHFYKYHTTYPGGISEYVALFISQLFAVKWAGAMVYSIIALGMVVLLSESLNHKTKPVLPFLLLPLIQVLVFMLMSDYLFNFSVVINLFMVTLFLYVFSIFDAKFKINSFIILIPLQFTIYFISGGAYFLIFSLSLILLLLFKYKRLHLILIATISILSFLIPFISFKFIYLTTFEQAFLRSVPDVAPMLRYSKPLIFLATLGMIPFIILVNLAGNIFISKNQNRLKQKNPTNISKSKIQRILPLAVQIPVLITFSIGLFFVVYNPKEKLKTEIGYFASLEKWDKVLENYSKAEEYNRMINFQFNRAIGNTGQMLDRLFDYPQRLGTQGLFLDRPFTSEIALPNSDLYFDLGNIDESQRFAFESQTLMPNSPLVIKRLIVNSLVLANYDAAKTFSKVLAENPVEKNWLEKYNSIIEDPELAPENKLIMEKRSIFTRQGGLFFTPRDKMIILLDKNSRNNKAFEYLIAFDLMEHDLVAFSKDMEFYNDQGYKKLPKVIEEAVVLFLSQRPDNEFLRGFRISKETVSRFREFVKVMNSSKGNREKAKIQAEAFSNTYWYYVLFVSPVVTKVKLETKPSEANY